MSFDALETSIAAGRPLRLYEFQRGVIRWRYTNADRPITSAAQVFEPLAITDDGLRQTGESSAEARNIIVPSSVPVARLYRAVPPASEIYLVIRDLQAGDPEVLVSYVGSIQGVNFPTLASARITCQSLSASLDRPGLRLGWERGCPHSLYDHNCKADRELFKVVASVDTLTGTTISAAEFATKPDDWFAGGFIEWSIGSGEYDQRGIIAHTGSELTLLGGTAGLSLGLSVTAFAGCVRTAEVCDLKFGNLPNYGGVPGLPGKSPFDGSPIF